MKAQVHIIGGGISGLIAASVLEDHGLDPVILEAGDRLGGRLRTDKADGHLLDHGFQVLLTAYPAANKYLDMAGLQLKEFLPGSVVFSKGKSSVLGDASRNSDLLWPTLRSDAASPYDKWKVWQLSREMKRKSLEAIFCDKEKTTLKYLQDKGFSDRIIEQFFRPFYSGIFLENELRTSSRMFEFVFKMFAEGGAALPKDGIEAIPRELEGKLKRTSIHLNKGVAEIREHDIILNSGEAIAREYVINATNDPLLHDPNAKHTFQRQWKSCQTLYFKSDQRQIEQAMIGLVANPETFVNNICYPTALFPHPKGEQLLSVTIVKEHGLSGKELVARVVDELKDECGISHELEFLALYDIPQALPELNDLKYDLEVGSTRQDDHTFLTGDTMLNASLNGAMLAGERAALDLLDALQEREMH
jgi:protoporphyrinogen oxidase